MRLPLVLLALAFALTLSGRSAGEAAVQWRSPSGQWQGNAEDGSDVNIGGGKWGELLDALNQDEPEENRDVDPHASPGLGMAGQPGAAAGDYLDTAGLKTNENTSDHSALLRFHLS